MQGSIFLKKIVFCSAVILFTFSGWAANADMQQKSNHYLNAEIALAKGDAELASLELKLALQANPLDSNAHFLLGSLLAAQGLEDQAIIGFQRAVKIDPTHSEALHNLGTLLLRRGELAWAETDDGISRIVTADRES